MPNIAALHPQVVHFVVGLLIVGVLLRVLSIFGRPRFAAPAAAALLIAGTIATWFAVQSGIDAHGPVERIPGVRDLVVHHEEKGILTRNIFLVVALIELAALFLATRESLMRHVKWAYAASALVGLAGLTQLYETAEHGGEIVYNYGGGPGLRSGNPADAGRVLLAGLYNQAMADRRAGRTAEAAELVALMSKRYPVDTNVQLLGAESLLLDSNKPTEALTALNAIKIAPADARLAARHATLKADAYLALGVPDMAKRTLSDAIAALPAGATQKTRLQAKLDSIK